jgi:hypothetical protein
MLQNVAAHNIRVSNYERHITYSVTKRTASQTLNAKCTLSNLYKTLCNFTLVTHFVTLYVMLRLRFGTLLCCGHLRFVTLRHVTFTFTLYCFTLCNLQGASDKYVPLGTREVVVVSFFFHYAQQHMWWQLKITNPFHWYKYTFPEA